MTTCAHDPISQPTRRTAAFETHNTPSLHISQQHSSKGTSFWVCSLQICSELRRTPASSHQQVSYQTQMDEHMAPARLKMFTGGPAEGWKVSTGNRQSRVSYRRSARPLNRVEQGACRFLAVLWTAFRLSSPRRPSHRRKGEALVDPVGARFRPQGGDDNPHQALPSLR